MSRNRAVAVLIYDNQLLVNYREHDNQKHFVFPGGGIEANETVEHATVREIDEEASIVITAGRLLYELHYDNGEKHFFLECKYVSGQPKLRESANEYQDTLEGNIHKPMWVDISKLSSITLYPTEVRNQLIKDVATGFSTEVIKLRASSY